MLESIQRFVRNALTENLRLKALALLITFMIFALVRGGREATARLTVDVEVIRPPETAKRVLMTDVPDTIKLRVSGSPRVVQLVNDEEIPPVTLDLRSEHDGPYLVDRSKFILPPGLEIVSLNPASISLRYEPRIEKLVTIRPLLTGQVAEGNHVEEPIDTDPAKVKLSCPLSVVRERESVETEPVLVDGLGPGRVTRRANVEPPPHLCHYVGPSRVTVIITVEPNFVERSFEAVSVEVRGAVLPAEAEPITVVVQGPPDVVGNIEPNEMTAYVELGEDGQTPGNYRREVQLVGLDPTLDARLVPAAVIVQVSRDQTAGDGEPGQTKRPPIERPPAPDRRPAQRVPQP